MDLSPRSMASLWMSGLEDEPDRCGEICVFEIFGDAQKAYEALSTHWQRTRIDSPGRSIGYSYSERTTASAGRSTWTV